MFIRYQKGISFWTPFIKIGGPSNNSAILIIHELLNLPILRTLYCTANNAIYRKLGLYDK